MKRTLTEAKHVDNIKLNDLNASILPLEENKTKITLSSLPNLHSLSLSLSLSLSHTRV
jgi:hypothetical protein